MNLPLEINQRVLNELASPADQFATRVLLLSVANGGPARLSGKRRKYTFVRDNEAGAHILDVPDSLWQHDLPKGPYRENLSICHDLQNVMGAKVPLVFIRIPWKDLNDNRPTIDTMSAHDLEIFGLLVKSYGVPPMTDEGLKCLIAAGPERCSDYFSSLENQKPASEDVPADLDLTLSIICGYFLHAKAPPHVTETVARIIATPGEFLQYLEPPPENQEEDDADHLSNATATPKVKSQSEAAIRMREKRAKATAERKRQSEPA